MRKTGIYLNFTDKTEEAFNFYRSVFGGEFKGGISRFADSPADPKRPPLSEEDKKLVMHVELPISDDFSIMGTDAPSSMGFKVVIGNNAYISLEPDDRAEADRIFAALSDGGKIDMPLQEMFWGAYYGSLADKYGVRWMINLPIKKT